MHDLFIQKNSLILERVKLSLILGASLASGYGLFLLSSDKVQQGGIWIILSVAAWMIGFWGVDWVRNLNPDLMEFSSKRTAWILFILVCCAGIFFRLYKLTEIPWGMSIDSSANTLIAFNILRGAPYEPLAIGRETMYFYFLAGFMKLFGYTQLAVRANSTFFGILAIVPFYLFVREVFKTKIAIISTFILATSIYHITYSRSEWRCIQVPVFEFSAFYFFYKALQQKKWWYWALTGVMIGLGLNTYDSFRLVPVAVGIFLLVEIFKKKFLAENWKGLLIFGLFAAVFFGPLGIYALTNWIEFSARASATLIFDKVIKAQSLQPLLDNVLNAFLTHIYHAQGDFFDNQKPLFSPLESLFYLGGLSFLLSNLRSKWTAFVLLIYLMGLIPAILTLPNSQRMITAIPITYIMDGLFLFAVLQQVRKAKLAWRWLPAVPIYLAVTIFLLLWAYVIYLGPQRRMAYGYEPERVVVALYAKRISANQEVIIDNRFNQGQVDFINYIPGSDPFLPRFKTFNANLDIPFRRPLDKNLTLILEEQPQNRDLVDPLKQLYPNLIVENIADHFNPDQNVAFAIHIPRQSLAEAHGYQASYYIKSNFDTGMVITNRIELVFPPSQIPNEANFMMASFQLWIDQLGLKTYVVSPGTMSITIDQQTQNIQNRKISLILSPGFHQVLIKMDANVLKANTMIPKISLLEEDGKPVEWEEIFNLQSPPAIWKGFPIRIAAQSWQDSWRTGGNGNDLNQFFRPMNLAVDPEGMIYVGDADNRRIVKLDTQGKAITTWGKWGDQPGALEHEISLALLDEELLVSDRWNDRIQVWDKYGIFKNVLIKAPLISSPHAIASLPDGTFLVVDGGSLEVLQFSRDGKLIRRIGTRGTCPGCFIEPIGIAFDSAGYIYVTDGGKHTLQKFDYSSGDFMKEWNISGITWESYVAVAPDRSVMVTLPDANTIYTLTPEGELLVFPTPSEGYQFFPIILNHPMGIILDASGNLYVTNTWADEVIKFSPIPTPDMYIKEISEPNYQPDAFPTDLKLTPELVYSGSTKGIVDVLLIGKVLVNNNQFSLNIVQMPNQAAVYDSIWFVDPNGKTFSFEAEDSKITQGDTFSSNPGLDGHWWLQKFGDFSGGYGLVAEKGETVPPLTTRVTLPDGEYQLFMGTFCGDSVSGPFSLGVIISK